jgi:peptide deformylase
MTVRRIRHLGDPVLRVRCEQVLDPRSASIRLVADDLRDTLRAARKRHRLGRAMAAPQIGAPVRVVFLESDRQRWTMVNPEITDIGSDDFLVWDDCFCFPNLLVRVSRAYQITVRYGDLKGTEHSLTLEGPMAELVQHEIDHLDGILAVDRAAGLDPFAFRTEWEKLHGPDERHGGTVPRELP